ncbi:MAG: hypothetical protein Q4B73_00460 [Lachnospiraceae bacterium]|nr:hypothetical protein [Lachnospiraceae bacterium]
MIVRRMIDNYMKEALRFVPVWKRGQARRQLNDMIVDMLEAYCEGERPTMRDVKTVLQAIGSPQEAALSLMEDMSVVRKRRGTKDNGMTARLEGLGFDTADPGRFLRTLLTVVGVVLVLVGFAAILAGHTGQAILLVIGLVLAVVSSVGRVFLPERNRPVRRTTRQAVRPHHDQLRA